MLGVEHVHGIVVGCRLRNPFGQRIDVGMPEHHRHIGDKVAACKVDDVVVAFLPAVAQAHAAVLFIIVHHPVYA